MPDTEISRLPELPAALVDDQDVLAIADISASETKKVRASELTRAALGLLPPGTIDAIQIDFSTTPANSIDGSAIKDRSLDAIKIVADSITAAEIAPNAIGSSELANNGVDTAAIQPGAVTGEKIANNSIDDTKIVIGGISAIAANAIGTNEIADNAVNGSKIAPRSVQASHLAGDIDGPQLLENSITSRELDDDSVGTTHIQDIAVVSDKIAPLAVDNSKISSVDGSKLVNLSVTANKFDPNGFTSGIELSGTVQHINKITPGTANGIIYDGNGHVTGSAPLQPLDLPVATTTSIGGISVPPESGLTVNGTGQIDHADTIAAGTLSGITYNSHGHITATTPLVGDDLPPATATELGAVIVPSTNSNPLAVDGNGNITHAQKAITPDTYVAVTVDQYGHVTAGSTVLTGSQLPGIDAGQITSGQFGTARLEDNSVTMPKLADYSISFIREAEPPITTELHIGCLWYQESTGQLRMWNGNSWMPVGFGRLSQENLRWGGTFDASTGIVTATTEAATRSGITAGDQIPAATNALGGIYFVADIAGANTAVLPGVNFDKGDWILCINQAEGWIKIDAVGGGGGTALVRLDELLDVNLTNPQSGDILIYDGVQGKWVNKSGGSQALSLSPAFDGITTRFSISRTVGNQVNILLSIAGVIQEPGIDFVIASGTNEINFSTPPAASAPYFMVNYASISSGGGGGGGGTNLPNGTAANEFLQWDNSLSAWVPSTVLDGGTFGLLPFEAGATDYSGGETGGNAALFTDDGANSDPSGTGGGSY